MRGAWILAVVLPVGACSASTFTCLDDAACGADGTCEGPGFCAFPSDGCPSGMAYGSHAGSGFAGECVEVSESDTDVSSTTVGTSGGTTEPATTIPATSDGSSSGEVTTNVLTGGTSGETVGVGLTTDPDSSSSGTTIATDASSSVTTDAMLVDEVVANYAACAFYQAAMPDPAGCGDVARAQFGLSVDLMAGADMVPTAGYLAFSLPIAYPEGSVAALRLRLTTLDPINAAGNQSGEVWRVESFAEDSLVAAVPAQAGTEALAADLGMVQPATEIIWELPPGTVEGVSSVFLGVFPVTTDGVDYWAHDGAAPPTLEIVHTP